MVAICRGLCVRYKITKRLKVGRYADGQKRCNSCGVFMKWDGLYCPCCGHRLRLKPRSRKYKEKVLQVQAQNQGKLTI